VDRHAHHPGRSGIARRCLIVISGQRASAWLGLVIGALALITGPTAAEPIRPNDVLSVRIIEWRTVESELRDWSAFGGRYTVASDGTINFPFIGDVQTNGLTEGDLANTVSEALSNRFALVEPLQAVVSRDDAAAIIVGGAVRSPGQVAFFPGMTARHAISLAGGSASSQLSAVQGRIELLSAQSQLSVITSRENVLHALLARLRADRDGSDTLVIDPAMARTLGQLVASEQALLTLTLQRRARELALVRGRISTLEAEIEALKAKRISLETQRDLVAAEKTAIDALSERGLTVNARVLDANRTLATVETQVLDVTTASLRAQQSLASAQSDQLALVDGAASTVLRELQNAEAELADVQARRASQSAITTLLGAQIIGNPEATLQVTIYRRVEGTATQLTEALDTVLLPGDLVEIALPPLRNGG
jgi:exopolysaccharide production protein ExoF